MHYVHAKCYRCISHPMMLWMHIITYNPVYWDGTSTFSYALHNIFYAITRKECRSASSEYTYTLFYVLEKWRAPQCILYLPATLSFSAVPELGAAVVVLFVEFAAVPLITRFSTLDSSFPMRCKILSNRTASVFFRSNIWGKNIN